MGQEAAVFDQISTNDLRVPREYAKLDEHAEAGTLARLEQWKRKACDVLATLRDQLRSRESVSLQTQVEVIYFAASFDGFSPWVLEASRTAAQDILTSYEKPATELLERVLRDFVKPVFSLNPHPNVNVETGRKLPRSAGGTQGNLDYLEGQEWKSHPELFNVVSWCLRHVDGRAVERLWHLFIPPIMTYLDDYQASYKVQGVRLASQLLQNAPSSLLRRTGIDVLLSTSLRTCLTFLHDPETPDLIRAAVSTHLRLIQMTTDEGSAARFEQLCSLLGDSIIGNIWIYASREPGVIEASMDCIPEIVGMLDVGTTRYLKALIPQLVFPLIPAPENGASVGYKLSSARALHSVLRVCVPRIHKWRGTISEAALKCWVELADAGVDDEAVSALRYELRNICAALAEACCTTAPQFFDELQAVVSLDVQLFRPLTQDLLISPHCNR
ncbi:hypothetical protein BD414DRAFT_441962 [Trametes punicea]|nr:hypothetical protein BD414DRAFT_441962 [Trametes punicea]